MAGGADIAVRCDDGRTFAARPRETALLVIDMQRDFLDADGMSAVTGTDVAPLRAIVPNVAAVTAAARRAGVAVIHTREGYAADLADVPRHRLGGMLGRPGPLGRFLVRGEPGHDFVAELMPAPGEAVIDKPGFSAFSRTGLAERLEAAGITRLVLCGVTTQCCVHSTLRSAVDRGYWCLTLADACAAFEPEVHAAALRLIRAENNLFGWIADTASFVEAAG
jgi:nicotinamidase-related amidase